MAQNYLDLSAEKQSNVETRLEKVIGSEKTEGFLETNPVVSEGNDGKVVVGPQTAIATGVIFKAEAEENKENQSPFKDNKNERKAKEEQSHKSQDELTAEEIASEIEKVSAVKYSTERVKEFKENLEKVDEARKEAFKQAAEIREAMIREDLRRRSQGENLKETEKSSKGSFSAAVIDEARNPKQGMTPGYFESMRSGKRPVGQG